MNVKEDVGRRLENLDWIIAYLMKKQGVSFSVSTALEDKQRMMRALMNIMEPKPLSDEFFRAQDWELQLQKEEKGVVEVGREGISLWQGDITRLKVDAIVNAANNRMLGCMAPLHACIDNAIHSAAGLQLRMECHELMKRQGHLEETGMAKITKGYNLPAKHVIHTVGPIIATGTPSREQEGQLAACYRSCLDIAEENGLESIAFCCISTGVFRFPNEQAAGIALRTVREYERKSVRTVVFNVFKDMDYDIYRKLIES